ncbi:MAG: GUN4 domain-containing protein [Synechococcales cyanobacterium RU_4_20]|nr:GUN4 domain-containing protein [Synechococcales cyanobacterium RU_4_20]
MAARQIKETDQEVLLYEFLKDADADGENQSWWRQTILLYAAQAKDPTVLIEAAMAQGANNLAYACYQETKRTLNPAIVQKLEALKPKVQVSRYGELERLLKAGEWEAADKETYRLMITTVNKEEGQWFDPEDLENFPCEDLRTIDRLWVEASNGHFGFSVQKRLAGMRSPMSLGKDWDRFCVKVGWQINKQKNT